MSDEWLESTAISDLFSDETNKVETLEVLGTSEYISIPQEKAVLIVLVGSDVSRTYTVESEVLIGRAVDVKVCVNTDDVSRHHARIRREYGQFTIEDLSSTNGTLVNGIPIKKQTLQYGDKIRIGSKTIFMFSQYDSLEDQLLQAQRLESIGKLAGGVAHDFNNIIAAILANIGFLRGLSRRVTFDDREVRECLEDLDSAARRAAELTKQLLGLARKDRSIETVVDFKKIVTEVINLIRRTASSAITIKSNIGNNNLLVLGHGSELHQMLMNLCINACDAMTSGGTLELTAKAVYLQGHQLLQLPSIRPGNYIMGRVSDTGVGIEKQLRRRIFEPFFTTKGHGQGTGLGLATVKKIITNHGGQILVDSQPGRGTHFTFYLPASTSAATKAENEFEPQGTQDILMGTVLVVDDDLVFLNNTRRLLGQLGFSVKCANNGLEAIRIFERERSTIELVLLDLMMPQLDGVDTFYALRKLDPLAQVLICSEQADLAKVRQLITEGACGFLQKPFDAEALGKAISRIMFPS